MRIKVQFGNVDTKEISWHDNVMNFPQLIKYLGRNYEWAVYDKDLTGKVDWILIFGEVPSYDPNFYVDAPLWTDLFNEPVGGCECGARYSSFPWDHFRYCRFWKPWNKI